MVAYTHLIGKGLRTEDGSTLPLTGILAHLEQRKAVYICVDVGAWYANEVACVAMRDVLIVKDHLHSTLSRADLDAAPRLEGPAEGWFSSFDLTTLPPRLVGPFGNTVSPLMLAAAAKGGGRNAGAQTPDGPTLPEHPRNALDPLGALVSAEAFGRDGPLGHVRDVDLREDGHISGFLLEHTLHDAPAVFLIPQERFSHRGEEHGHLIFDTTAAGVRRATLLAS